MKIHDCSLSYPPRSVSRAFSLIEIMIVLAILAILTGVVVTNFTGTMENANIDAASVFVKSSVSGPMLQYKIHTGSYPSTSEGLQALISAPSGKGTRWRGPYLNETEVPEDPWGNPYQYRFPATKNPKKGEYDLFSMGPDQQPDTADDIGNWD